jgi:hypothetical protein
MRRPSHLVRTLCFVAIVVVAAGTASESRLLAKRDADNDGVPNSRDACPATTRAARVDALGCARVQIDSDGDSVCNKNRPIVRSNGQLAPSRWCTGIDNCGFVKNPNQWDSDRDGRGDACDLGTCAAD